MFLRNVSISPNYTTLQPFVVTTVMCRMTTPVFRKPDDNISTVQEGNSVQT
jgi:hypothetical protein